MSGPEERLDELQAAGAVNSFSRPNAQPQETKFDTRGVPKNSATSICLVVSGSWMFAPIHRWLAKMHRLSSKISINKSRAYYTLPHWRD